MYTKFRAKGNPYEKSANTNYKILSNEHVDNFVSALYKRIKSSASDVANLTNISNNSPATTGTTDTETRLQLPTLSDSSFLPMQLFCKILQTV